MKREREMDNSPSRTDDRDRFLDEAKVKEEGAEREQMMSIALEVPLRERRVDNSPSGRDELIYRTRG